MFPESLSCLCQVIIHWLSKLIPHQDFCFEPTEKTAPLSQCQQAAFWDATLASTDSGTGCCSCPYDPVFTKDLVIWLLFCGTFKLSNLVLFAVLLHFV